MPMRRRMSLFLAAALALLLGLFAGCSPATIVPSPLPMPTKTAASSPPPDPTATAAQPTPAAQYTPTPQPQVDAPAWFGNGILYEIFPRSFADADGDGIGDLDGIAGRLEYLQSLGATALWLTPIHPSPSYHGYDVTDYLAVHPDLGTHDDLEALVQAAHERGIKVILDLVANHTSDKHPFFVDAWGNPESEYADWYLWSNEDHTAYQTFGGYKAMPKLNHGNPEVVAYVLDVARFWMDLDGDGDYRDGVDGFRCDVAKEVPLATWQALRDDMRQNNPESLLLGEVWDNNVRNLAPWYDDAFDAVFNFPLYGDLAASPDVSGDSLLAGAQRPDMVSYTVLGEQKLLPAGFQIVQFVNNHDTNRVMSDVGDDWARARTAAALLLTLPGTPMIYYGEEIGMRGEKGQGTPYWDEYRREPMDWYAAEAGSGQATWFMPKDRHNAPADGISVEEQADVSGSLLEHYRALTGLRLTHPALWEGAFAPAKVKGSQEVYAFTRHAPPADGQPEEWFLVVMNFGAAPQQASLELALAYPGPFSAQDALSGKAWPEVPAGQAYPVELEAATGVVLKLRPASGP